MFALAVQRGFLDFTDKEVLHFAPEEAIAVNVDKAGAKSRTTADIDAGKAELVLNIEAINLPDESVDAVICSHVLEHVDDAKALSEMRRLLRPGGAITIMIPIIEGWDRSYENTAISSAQDRELHFGQSDHVRYYGSDFRARVTAAGLKLAEFTAEGADCVRHAFIPGEKVFLATKA